MIYLYDKAICEDLQRSFNPDNVPNPVVKVIDPEGSIGLTAQILEDKIKFPVVSLDRSPETTLDASRANFTRLHRGVQTILDPETNLLYYEKAIPIKLEYQLTALTTNIADMDEIMKEVLFKYTQMYFLTLTLPYECKRKIRFGVAIDPDVEIERKSGSFEFLDGGTLHQSKLNLRCEGCMLVSYTPVKLKRTETHVETV